MGRVVMVTGVSRYLGGRFTQLLQADPDISRVIGVDVVPPKQDLGDAEFVRADIRNPIIGKVIAQADVDTVVHMAVIATPVGAGGRAMMKEINVIGTMQLLAACQKAPSVRKLVVKSSSAVYGSSPNDPALFTEDTEPKAMARTGYAKDSVEVEGYVRGFARRRPDVKVTTLRFANFVGPRVQTPLSAYFSLPVVPTVLGFDPRLQFVHERDGIEVLWRTTLEDHPGTFNVAGEGVMTLSQAIHRAGRPVLPLPHPAAPWIGQVLRRFGVADFSPEQIRFLSYGRVLDTTRMRDDLGFTPRYTTREAFDDFVREQGLRGLLSRDTLGAVERRLLDVLASGSSDVRGHDDADVRGHRQQEHVDA
jgi:UDP-glucose 4-epimerase